MMPSSFHLITLVAGLLFISLLARAQDGIVREAQAAVVDEADPAGDVGVQEAESQESGDRIALETALPFARAAVFGHAAMAAGKPREASASASAGWPSPVSVRPPESSKASPSTGDATDWAAETHATSPRSPTAPAPPLLSSHRTGGGTATWASRSPICRSGATSTPALATPRTSARMRGSPARGPDRTGRASPASQSKGSYSQGFAVIRHILNEMNCFKNY